MCNDGRGVSRLYLGLETANNEASSLLNKRITYDEKKQAAELIKQARIGLKVIAQIGVVGKGFYPLGEPVGGRFVPWYTAQDDTIRWINDVQPYRVMLSDWQNYGNLPINALINEGRIVQDDDPEKVRTHYGRERRRLMDNIRVDWRRTAQEVIEPDYHQYLGVSIRGRPAIARFA